MTIWSLLRKNISKEQMIGYSLANIIGLSIALVGILFYNDSQHDNSQKDSFFSNDYVVLSKIVEGINFTPTSFSEEEIEDLGKQKWVKKIGRFTSSQFAVNGSVDMGGKRLSTYLFCESVPDEFFDIKPKDWNFTPESHFVPIILCKDYLALYNFGFAVPQHLPQISEEIIGSIPITLRLSGENMKTVYFDASIVGFSSRLNTIAVPQSFMDWANECYSNGNSDRQTSRLIVKVNRLSSADMKSYLDEHQIEIAGDKEETGKISSFLGIVSAVVTTNGIVICLLAIFILVLSIFLLLQKSREKLRDLMLLGYSPRQVARHYETLVIIVNLFVTVISIAMAFISRTFWEKGLDEIGLGEASAVPMLILSFLYLIGVTAFDVFVIRKQIMRIWKDI